MKIIPILFLIFDIILVSAIFVYKIFFSQGFSAPWVFLISVLIIFAVFCVISMRLFASSQKDLITNTWIALLSLGFTYLAADLLAGYLLIEARPASMMVKDPVVHHRLIPNAVMQNTKPEFSVSVSTNQYGLRVAGIQPRDSFDQFRILMLGDSFTMGLGVEDDETFSALLERSLNRSGDRLYHVLNGGVSSHAPILSYLLLREYLSELDFDLVVLNLDMSDLIQESAYRSIARFDERGDIRAVPNSRKLWIGRRIQRWVWDHLYVGSLVLRYFIDRVSPDADAKVAKVVERANLDLLAHTLAGDTIDREKEWNDIFDSIKRIKAFCDERGIGFFMTTYPWGHQVNNKEWVPGRISFVPPGSVISDTSVSTVERLSKSNGIELLNLFPAFRARQDEGPIYFDMDVHWRPIGHRIMAEELEAFIRARYLFVSSK